LVTILAWLVAVLADLLAGVLRELDLLLSRASP
jgi:hypothetical protein